MQNDLLLPVELPKIKRQTQMYCIVCKSVAETYNQRQCINCGSVYKWSISWKNHYDPND